MATTWKRELSINRKGQPMLTGIEIKEDGSPSGIIFSSALDWETTDLENELMKRVQRQFDDYKKMIAADTPKMEALAAGLDTVDNGDFDNYIRGDK
jgi:hypothetical protein